MMIFLRRVPFHTFCCAQTRLHVFWMFNERCQAKNSPRLSLQSFLIERRGASLSLSQHALDLPWEVNYRRLPCHLVLYHNVGQVFEQVSEDLSVTEFKSSHKTDFMKYASHTNIKLRDI